MSLLYDEFQETIAVEAARVLHATARPQERLALLERRGEFDRGFWASAIAQGWPALALPERSGGLGLGLVELGIVAGATGATISGAPFLTTNYLVARALLDYAEPALADTWVPRLAAGEATAAVAFAEKSDPLPPAISTHYRDGTVRGTKSAVVGGACADCALVLADGALVFASLADPGSVRRTVLDTFDNTRCAADLMFAGCDCTPVVAGPASRDAALYILAVHAVIAAHEAVGGAEALMLRARDYACTRRAFGQPIGAFQAVKHRIAELYVLVELARANAIHAATRDRQADFVQAAAAARLSAIEAYDAAARDAVQVHGGIGVTWESGLHLHQRRARTLAIEAGNAMFWEDVLVDTIVRQAA